MGTNYYLDLDCCPHCGRGTSEEPLHIGKSSAGWNFMLHVMPEDGIGDLEDWERLWSLPNTRIRDEYGEVITSARMKEVITERSWHRGLRRSEDPQCIKQGAGTWDCIVGEFS